jgi:hypothetical protein
MAYQEFDWEGVDNFVSLLAKDTRQDEDKTILQISCISTTKVSSSLHESVRSHSKPTKRHADKCKPPKRPDVDLTQSKSKSSSLSRYL